MNKKVSKAPSIKQSGDDQVAPLINHCEHNTVAPKPAVYLLVHVYICNIIF